MPKTLFLILIVLAVAGATYWTLTQTGKPDGEITHENIDLVRQSRPELSNGDSDRLAFLKDNAIRGIGGFGDPRDAIPSVDEPRYESVSEADQWLQPDDVVFGVKEGDFIVAYPQRILVWHEIVNEEIGGEKKSVTYCPLTGTAIGFKGEITTGVEAEFGVSGKLVNSNLIMYDRTSNSYWPQILGQAIDEPAKGTRLKEFPVIWTTWERWKLENPGTRVLSRDTGFRRDYGVRGDPYGSYLGENMGYYDSDRTIFSLLNEDDRLPPKHVVAGIRDSEGNAVAIDKERIRNDGVVRAQLGGREIEVVYDSALDFYEARYTDTDEWINAFDAMWFAWAAFYPHTNLIN